MIDHQEISLLFSYLPTQLKAHVRPDHPALCKVPLRLLKQQDGINCSDFH